MSVVYLGVGSNLGDRLTHLTSAIDRLRAHSLTAEAVSSVWETEPVGGPAQPAYLNAAARLRTGLDPHGVLAAIQATEHAAGRQRGPKNGPRTLDLDLLLFDEVVLEEPDLVVPHPRLAERRFVLVPLAEVAAVVRHPVLRQTVGELLAGCTDAHRVEFYCKWPGRPVE